MNREQTIQKLRECQEAAERGEPLSMADMAEYNRLRAAELARAEARRQGSPQLPLEAAA